MKFSVISAMPIRFLEMRVINDETRMLVLCKQFHLASFITIYNHGNLGKMRNGMWISELKNQSLYQYTKVHTYGHPNIWLHVRP